MEGGGIGISLTEEQYAACHGGAYEMKSPLLAPVFEKALFSARPDDLDVPDLPVTVPYRDQQSTLLQEFDRQSILLALFEGGLEFTRIGDQLNLEFFTFIRIAVAKYSLRKNQSEIFALYQAVI
uniref:Uncharacterized protein n=1 Tax=Candidatus Kentrum sp. DK TaxID=2126562 RepID=A0A450TEL1_9GAMM|nr:MAG: hypothetical protein BECKDK2373B_GA0170837_11514 [Candidatus Kentron sp. DK]